MSTSALLSAPLARALLAVGYHDRQGPKHTTQTLACLGRSLSSPYILYSWCYRGGSWDLERLGTLFWSPRESKLQPPKLLRLTIHKAVENSIGFAPVSIHGDYLQYLRALGETEAAAA